MDESTDITTKKILCLLVRYPKLNGKVVTTLLELIHLDALDCSAQMLFKEFKSTLQKHNLSTNKLLGLACDGASVMVGKNNSFFTLLNEEVPHLLLLRCVCHSSALVASKACSVLPGELEELIRGIYTYISGSSKRCAQLVEIQSYFNMQHYKVLKLSGTRWLSVHQCVVRTLINWDALTHFFTIAVFEDNLISSSKILDLLKDPKIKAYMLFLKYSLDYMNSFNALFQSGKIQIHLLSKNSNRLLQQFLQNFIKPETLESANNITASFIHPHNYLPLEEIYVGRECKEFLIANLSLADQNSFMVKILEFYSILAKEMINRLPLGGIYSEFEFLCPEIAFEKNRKRLIDMPLLCNKYKNILDVNAISDEWRILPFSLDCEEVTKLKQLPIDEMWHTISEYKDFDGIYKFKNLAELSKFVLTLPHSNAEAERIFSSINDIKTKKRNRIGDETLNALAIVRSSFSALNIDCTKFKPSDEHFRLFTQDIYKKEN